MMIRVCMHCLSADVRIVKLEEGAIPGTTELSGFVWCNKCRHKCLPIVFENKEEYEKFVKERRKRR